MLGKSFETQKALLAYAKKHNIKIMFNPSGYVLEKRKNLVLPMLAHTDILIINAEESLHLAQGSLKERIVTIAGYGPDMVIITDGKKGAHAYHQGMMYSIIPHKVHVVEATGAGDAFGSGFLGGYITTQDIETAMQVALANAQSTIQYFGAKNILLSWQEALKTIKKHPAKIITTRL